MRPTVLIAEPEPIEALSTRKLVMESAKFNVMTAHDYREALDVLDKFPKIDAIVVVHGLDVDCSRLALEMRQTHQKTPLIALSPRIGDKCESADHNLSSHQPELLVDLVRSLFGDPRDGSSGNARSG